MVSCMYSPIAKTTSVAHLTILGFWVCLWGTVSIMLTYASRPTFIIGETSSWARNPGLYKVENVGLERGGGPAVNNSSCSSS